MAQTIGAITMRGRVVIEWENGQRTECGSVETDVEMVLRSENPITIYNRVDPK